MALRPVYSVQIMALAPALPVNTVVVPDGSVLVIRDIDLREESGTTAATSYLQNAAGGILAIWANSTENAERGFSWRGRQVFNPGESIVFHVVSGTWSIQMSGYELTSTA